MIYLRFDMNDSRVVFDSPNVRFIDGKGVLLEPGDALYTQLAPGTPGYQAPPDPPPTRKRRARLSAQELTALNLNTTTATTMDSHFHFNVVPMPSGDANTTRVVFQEDLGTAELVTLVKAALLARGIEMSEAHITATGEEIGKATIASGLARGRPVRRAFGYLTWEPACGGRHADPDFTPTAENMNATGRGRLSPQGQVLFDSLVTFHRDGVVGSKVPIVTRVFDGTLTECDCLTLGGPFRLSGPKDFGPQPAAANALLGVFLQRTGGTPVRIGAFSEWTESEIFGSWPAAISGTGTVELRVVTQYTNNSQLSTFVYGTPLTVGA